MTRSRRSNRCVRACNDHYRASSELPAWMTSSIAAGSHRPRAQLFARRQSSAYSIDTLTAHSFACHCVIIAALRWDGSQSVKLDNPSDWQLLVELTAQENAAKKASEIVGGATGAPSSGEADSSSSGSSQQQQKSKGK